MATQQAACMQVTDGAAAVLMMTRGEAMKRQLPILGIFRSFAAVGVDPAIMGVGPAVAIPEAVKQAGLAIDDIDLFELNEAFASQVTDAVFGFCIAGFVLTLLRIEAGDDASYLAACTRSAVWACLCSLSSYCA